MARIDVAQRLQGDDADALDLELERLFGPPGPEAGQQTPPRPEPTLEEPPVDRGPPREQRLAPPQVPAPATRLPGPQTAPAPEQPDGVPSLDDLLQRDEPVVPEEDRRPTEDPAPPARRPQPELPAPEDDQDQTLPRSTPDTPSTLDLPESFDFLDPQPEQPEPADVPLEDDRVFDSEPESELGEFNRRDCAAEIGACKQAWKEIQEPISQLTLDITPSIEPRELDMARVIEARDKLLSQAPARTWRDRQGRVLGEGHLQDYRQAQVHIRLADGTTRSVHQQDLSDEDWCFLNAWWQLPTECRLGDETNQLRDWTLSTFTWTASALCHKPLYFEQPQVERYGHTRGPVIQPVLSAAHFFGSVFVLPYKMGLNPPTECQYALGYYRPGNCAPHFLHAVPLSGRAVRWQLAAVGAAFAVFP
jgi:hypothetical protein